MSKKNIQITDIADFESVDVVEILVQAGDEIAVDQPLITVESEKAMMDYPSPYAGVVDKVLVEEGNKVSEGDTIIVLDMQEHENTTQGKVIQKVEQPNSQPKLEISKEVSQETNTASSQQLNNLSKQNAYASPGTQKYARELGVSLDDVQGSGRKQRVLIEDVQQHVRQRLGNGSGPLAPARKPLDFSKYGASETKDLNKIQKLTAENMLHAWNSIPHVTHFDQADVTQLELHRKKLAKELSSKQIKLTPLAFVAKALVVSLKQFPQFNSSLDDVAEKIIYKDFFHIGIAVDTEYGLFVPVLRDVDKKPLEQVAKDLIDVSELARKRKLTPSHMGGASMTISSLGNLGGQAFTPIINPPEVAILGLSKMIINEKTSGAETEQQKLLPLSLSYDHRVINGAEAARFCTHLKNVLEDIWKLIL